MCHYLLEFQANTEEKGQQIRQMPHSKYSLTQVHLKRPPNSNKIPPLAISLKRQKGQEFMVPQTPFSPQGFWWVRVATRGLLPCTVGFSTTVPLWDRQCLSRVEVISPHFSPSQVPFSFTSVETSCASSPMPLGFDYILNDCPQATSLPFLKQLLYIYLGFFPHPLTSKVYLAGTLPASVSLLPAGNWVTGPFGSTSVSFLPAEISVQPGTMSKLCTAPGNWGHMEFHISVTSQKPGECPAESSTRSGTVTCWEDFCKHAIKIYTHSITHTITDMEF